MTTLDLDVGAVAHGGHCVARHDGRVVFVRHALPGERVRATVTEGAQDARFWRADAVEVLDASPHRVPPRCPVAVAGGCGGCDWQHVDLAEQRRLKAGVVAEQLRRLGGLDVDPEDVTVAALPGDDEGLGWRTRLRLAVDADGRAGLRRHRSHAVVPIDDCPIAHRELGVPDVVGRQWPPGGEVVLTGGNGDPPTVEVADPSSPRRLRHVSGARRRQEVAAGRSWQVTGSGFWQVHPGAAQALVDAVRRALQTDGEESLLDLYGGVGLFAGTVGFHADPDHAPGPGSDPGSGPGSDPGAVAATGAAPRMLVESDAQAVRDARHNLRRDGVSVHGARVERWLRSPAAPSAVDLVVLDPPRSGARRAVCDAIVRLRPRRVVYVACDPAALARDLRTFAEQGYHCDGLEAFDMFPMTHHVECVVSLRPNDGRGRMVAAEERDGYSQNILTSR